MLNKKGNILSIWWFAVLTIVGAGVILGVVLFYSSYLDVKTSEADILSNKIERCFVENKLNITSINFLDEFDIFEKCDLNRGVFSESNFFLKISINDDKVYKYGNNALEKDCDVKQGLIQAKKYPGCSNNEFVISDLNIKVLSASKNEGQSV